MKTIRQFEEGDVVVSLYFNHVAIRHALGKWAHSNSGLDILDSDINERLDDNSWFYIGNRKEQLDAKV